VFSSFLADELVWIRHLDPQPTRERRAVIDALTPAVS
jgi:hypothetical protein